MIRLIADALMVVWVAVLVALGGITVWGVVDTLYRRSSPPRARRRHRTSARS